MPEKRLLWSLPVNSQSNNVENISIHRQADDNQILEMQLCMPETQTETGGGNYASTGKTVQAVRNVNVVKVIGQSEPNRGGVRSSLPSFIPRLTAPV